MPFKTGPRPDILENRQGGGCLALFGLPFFLAGLFVMIASLGLIPEPHNQKPPPWYLGLPFGGLFVVVGGAFIFGRAGTVIDAADRKVTKWWGALGFRRRTEYDLDAFRSVKISREVRRSKNSTYTVYPVRLAGVGKPVHLEEPRDFQAARALAEQVAKFTGKDLVDATSGEEVVREAATLDESLRARARRTGAQAELPEPPADMQTLCAIEGNQVVLDMKGLRTRVTASPDLLRVEQKGLIFKSLHQIPSDEIEELILPGTGSPRDLAKELEQAGLPAPFRPFLPRLARSTREQHGIIARSDKISIEFGKGLPAEELRWIHAVIMKMLTA